MTKHLRMLLPCTATLLALGLFVGCEQQKTETSTTQNASGDPNASILRARAVEAVIWGMPAVNYDLMYQAMVNQTHGDFQPDRLLVEAAKLEEPDAYTKRNTVYIMPLFNTKDVGPMVLEIPPAGDGTIVGSIDDAWQTAIEDVGPAGADKGKRGKYLILPPDYQGKAPTGYLPMPSSTYESYAILRSILKSASDADIAKAVDYGKQIKVYPLSQVVHPPETKWNDALDVVFDSTIPYNERFFQSLNRIVQIEPWLERDKAMIDQLKSIGIEKGKPFTPDPTANEMLKAAATEAHTWLDANYEKVFIPPFNPGTQWALPASEELLKSLEASFTILNSYPVDARGLAYSYAFFSAKHLGAGQFYLMTIKDQDGQRLSGASTYKLDVPANVPVNQYWSATVYDGETHAFIRDVQRQSRSSQNPDLQKNTDGSFDVYFGPKAPDGKDSNWIPTNANGKFEVLFRLYGPEKAFFDKTWKLPDIEKVK